MSPGNKFSSLKDFRLLVVLVLGAAAFMFSMKLVIGSSQDTRFHEIVWDSRAVVSEMVTKAGNDSALITDYVKESVLPYETGKRQSMDSLLPSYRAAHLKALSGIKQKIAGLNDSLWDKYIETRLFLVPDSTNIDCLDIDSAKKCCTKDGSCLDKAEVVFMDTSFPLKQMKYKIPLPVKVYSCVDQFLSKYPLFGIWALLLVIQVTLFAFFITWLLVLLFVRSHDKNVELIQLSIWVKLAYMIVLVVVGAGLYHILLEGTDAGNALIKRQYFMAEINQVFRIANVMGYLTAGLCLAGIVFSLIEIGKADEDKMFTKDEVEYLESRFKHFLTIAGVLLSLAVFSTGTFISALNSLDFIKVLTRSLGHSPVPNDFVLLYGLAHTFILLIFYIPARYMLDKLKTGSDVAAEDQSWLPIKKLAQLAVVGSPLLAGMFQTLFEMFSN
ncbi:MAG: hypothetical protein JWQ38_2254 [Flavipsychrobacter sp.]|nr:hypothetical protein [Flavipsychrobacter sp.]